MNRFFQNGRRIHVQKLIRALQVILPDLNPICHARRTQKQKIPKGLVIVSPRLKPFASEKGFEHFPVVHVFKHRHIHPQLMFS